MVSRFSGVNFKGRGIEIDATTSVGRIRKTLLLPKTQKGLATANCVRSSILYDDQLGKLDLAEYFPNDRRLVAKSPNQESHLTIQECFRSWMKSRERIIQTTTIKQDWNRIDKYLAPHFGHFKINEIGVHHVNDFRNCYPLLENKTINNILSILTGMYKSLYLEAKLTTNPLDRYQHLPTSHEERTPYTLEETDEVLKSITNPQIRNYFIVAFETGLRPPTELLGLMWNDLDWDGKRIYICRALRNGSIKDLKTKQSVRYVDLSESALQALKEQRILSPSTDYIFVDPTTDQPYKNNESIRKRYWIPAIKKSGVRPEPPYVTRHTYASRNLSKGKNYMYVTAQMGHASPKMIFKHYGKYIPNDIDKP